MAVPHQSLGLLFDLIAQLKHFLSHSPSHHMLLHLFWIMWGQWNSGTGTAPLGHLPPAAAPAARNNHGSQSPWAGRPRCSPAATAPGPPPKSAASTRASSRRVPMQLFVRDIEGQTLTVQVDAEETWTASFLFFRLAGRSGGVEREISRSMGEIQVGLDL